MVALIQGLDALVKELAPKKDDQHTTEPSAIPSTADAPVAILPPPPGPTKLWDMVRDIRRRCFFRIQRLWDDLSDVSPYKPTATYLARILYIVSQCILRKQVESCRELALNILQRFPPTASNVRDLYEPLCIQLVATLKAHKISLASSPFVDLLQIVIGAYLRDVLGKKPASTTFSIRRVGCPRALFCQDCDLVNELLNDPSRNFMVSYWTIKRRQHIDKHLSSAKDLCTAVHKTFSSRKVSTTITKRKTLIDAAQALVAARKWSQNQIAATVFLQRLGGEGTTREIMKERWGDVDAALKGEKWFDKLGAPAPSAIVPPSSHRPPTTQVPLPQGTKRKGSDLQPGFSGSVTRSSAIASSSTNGLEGAVNSALSTRLPPTALGVAMVAPIIPSGTRTKQTARKSTRPVVQLGPVIDLTLEDSD